MNEHRDNSNRLSFDFDKIEGALYRKVTDTVVSVFCLEVASKKVTGFDEIAQDFKRGSAALGLEWDNWSGYTVVAQTTSAEPLVREISGYIEATFSFVANTVVAVTPTACIRQSISWCCRPGSPCGHSHCQLRRPAKARKT
jgi:hypothetical protein